MDKDRFKKKKKKKICTRLTCADNKKKRDLLLKTPRLIPKFLSQLFVRYSNMTFGLNIDAWGKTRGRRIGRSILCKKAFPFANVRHRYFTARFFRAELFRNLCACRHKVRNELRRSREKESVCEREKEKERERKGEDIIKLAAKLVLERGSGSAGKRKLFNCDPFGSAALPR
ncbi:hypothetical protein PUN28_004131 [Cardiocondyla obscurior]|uniref:Uncharacterized protein n=1 Tax=Cardiocondyla obscurior TaxID=286306 RepID=A0AAW2GPP4_9HYME